MGEKPTHTGLAESTEDDQHTKGSERRLGPDRRQFHYFEVIPDRRSGKDRRNAED